MEIKYSIFLYVFNKFTLPAIGSKMLHTVLQGIEPKGITKESTHLWTLYHLTQHKPLHFSWGSIDLRIIKKLKDLLEFQTLGQRRLPFRSPLIRNPFALKARGSRSAVSTLKNNYESVFDRFHIKVYGTSILTLDENFNFLFGSSTKELNLIWHYSYAKLNTFQHTTGVIIVPQVFTTTKKGYVVALNGWNFSEDDYTKVRLAYETHVQPVLDMELLLFPNDFFMAPCDSGGYCFTGDDQEYTYNVQSIIPQCDKEGGECQDFAKLLPALFLEELQRRGFTFKANQDFVMEQLVPKEKLLPHLRPDVKLLNKDNIFGAARHVYTSVMKMNVSDYNDKLIKYSILGGRRRNQRIQRTLCASK